MEVSIYRKLQKHMDTFPIGFPATQSGIEIKVLEYFFTEEEAEIALHLTIIPQNLNQIYRRVRNIGYTKAELKQILDKMVSKKRITRIEKGNKFKYRSDFLAVGLYEAAIEDMDVKLSELMLQYMEAGFRKEFFRKDTKLQLRTIPIEKSIEYEHPVSKYDDIRKLVEEATEILVGECVCRISHDLIHQPCQRTNSREWCFTFAFNGEEPIYHGKKRHLSKQEALKMFDQAEREGLVLQPSNSKKPVFVCVCCGCCCGVLSQAKNLDKPAQFFENNFISEVEIDLCIGCGKCELRCNMDAISIHDKKAIIDLTRCIGCGLCVSACPKDAIHLISKKKIKIPPKDTIRLYLKILQKKTSIIKILGLAVRTFLGIKYDP
jgi:ferredoxin